MDEIIKKFKIIKDKIVSDHQSDTIYFFGLAERFEIETKWDVILCASWITERHNQADLLYMIENLKEVFGEDLNFLGQIVLLSSEEKFVKELGMALEDKKSTEDALLYSLQIRNDFTIKQLYILINNLGVLNFSNDLIEESKKKDTVFTDF